MGKQKFIWKNMPDQNDHAEPFHHALKEMPGSASSQIARREEACQQRPLQASTERIHSILEYIAPAEFAQRWER